MGQLGGRRGDPRRGDRALHRPRQAALHRLRRQVLLGQRPVDHPAAAAGPAGGGGAGPRAARSTNSPPPAPIWSSSRPPTMPRCARSSTRSRRRGGRHLKVYADVVVSFAGDSRIPFRRTGIRRQPNRFGGLLLGWQRAGVDGVRLRPAVNATDLPVIVDEVVPLLQRAGRFRTALSRRRDIAGTARPARRTQPVRDGAADEHRSAVDPGPRADQRRQRRRDGAAQHHRSGPARRAMGLSAISGWPSITSSASPARRRRC